LAGADFYTLFLLSSEEPLLILFFPESVTMAMRNDVVAITLMLAETGNK
jgi:hypothetical protein